MHCLHTLLGGYGDLAVHIILNLFLVDNNCVGVILDGLVVASQHELGVGLAEVVFDHVIVAVLQGLADVLEGGLVLI